MSVHSVIDLSHLVVATPSTRSKMPLPANCNVSLNLTSIAPSAPYSGTVVLGYRLSTMCAGGEPTEGDARFVFRYPSQDDSELVPFCFHADPARVTIAKVSANAGKKAIKVSKIEVSNDDKMLMVALIERPALNSLSCGGGRLDLCIAFTATIAAPGTLSGLYCVPMAGSGMALLSQFEVTHAREAFPCPDDPLIRVPLWCMTCQLPVEYSRCCLSNTPIASVKENVGAGGKQSCVVFSPTNTQGGDDDADTSPGIALPAYVIALAAFPDRSMIHHELDVASPHHEGGQVTVRITCPAISSFPVHPFLTQLVRDAVTQLEAFFDSPLPVEGGRLDLLISPQMSLGGMEHHGCIFLNEMLCGSSSCLLVTKKPAQTHAAKMEEEIAQIVVHEIAHQWVGNAIGLPFGIKEGVCQILELCLGDVVRGKPMRKYQLAAATTASVKPAGKSKQKSSGGDGQKRDETEIQKGQELTGLTYQRALMQMTNVVAELGWAEFQTRMRRLTKEKLGTYVTADDFGAYFV